MASGDLNQASGIPWICESQQTCEHIDFFPSKILSSVLATPVNLMEQDLAIQSVAEQQLSASEGRFLEIQTFRPHARPNESEFAFERYPPTTQMYITF